MSADEVVRTISLLDIFAVLFYSFVSVNNSKLNFTYQTLLLQEFAFSVQWILCAIGVGLYWKWHHNPLRIAAMVCLCIFVWELVWIYWVANLFLSTFLLILQAPKRRPTVLGHESVFQTPLFPLFILWPPLCTALHDILGVEYFLRAWIDVLLTLNVDCSFQACQRTLLPVCDSTPPA